MSKYSNIYDHIPHVEFKGARIYMPDSKLETLKSREKWTVSQIQRHFKIGYNSAIRLLEYAQSIGVIGSPYLAYAVNNYPVNR